MVTFYYKRVINGNMTIDEVPIKWREQVQELLNKNK